MAHQDIFLVSSKKLRYKLLIVSYTLNQLMKGGQIKMGHSLIKFPSPLFFHTTPDIEFNKPNQHIFQENGLIFLRLNMVDLKANNVNPK